MIRKASPHEAEDLTRISFAAKRYWHYPEDYYQIWKEELTVTSSYITDNEVYLFDDGVRPIGYYSLVELPEPIEVSGIELVAGLWLDHMFVYPEEIGKGLGTRLFDHCITITQQKNHSVLRILAEPNAVDFYLKMGCKHLYDHPSTIPGRTTPYLEYAIAKNRL